MASSWVCSQPVTWRWPELLARGVGAGVVKRGGSGTHKGGDGAAEEGPDVGRGKGGLPGGPCPGEACSAVPFLPWPGRRPTSGPRLIMAKRIAFHSLLHQWRYETTRLMSRLMSRPCGCGNVWWLWGVCGLVVVVMGGGGVVGGG